MDSILNVFISWISRSENNKCVSSFQNIIVKSSSLWDPSKQECRVCNHENFLSIALQWGKTNRITLKSIYKKNLFFFSLTSFDTFVFLTLPLKIVLKSRNLSVLNEITWLVHDKKWFFPILKTECSVFLTLLVVLLKLIKKDFLNTWNHHHALYIEKKKILWKSDT